MVTSYVKLRTVKIYLSAGTKMEKDFKNNTFKVLSNVETDKSKYTCTAENPVHNNTSDPVEAACKYFVTFISGRFYNEYEYAIKP